MPNSRCFVVPRSTVCAVAAWSLTGACFVSVTVYALHYGRMGALGAALMCWGLVALAAAVLCTYKTMMTKSASATLDDLALLIAEALRTQQAQPVPAQRLRLTHD